jgi:RNA methyltransferase, TrmH family
MITSQSNHKIKEIRLLKQARHRDARGEYFVEGVRLVEEALCQASTMRKILYSPRVEESPRGMALLSTARKTAKEAEWLSVSDEVLGSVSDTQSHQGILAVLGKSECTWEDLAKREGMVLLLWELQDPGNLGTIFRVAEAGGSAGLVLSRASVDPHSPKVLRASMGSFFRLPFVVDQNFRDCLKSLRRKGRRIWAAAAGRGGTPLWEADLAQPSAVIFGQEGAGIPEEVMGAADGELTIPMTPPTESLNVALAAGLVIYEAFRQRTVRSNVVRSSE